MGALAIIALSVVYVIGGFSVACRIATLLAWYWLADNNRRWRSRPPAPHPTSDQWAGAACIGLLCAPAWPVVLGAVLARGVLFAPPHDVRLERQEAKIKELEQELGIR